MPEQWPCRAYEEVSQIKGINQMFEFLRVDRSCYEGIAASHETDVVQSGADNRDGDFRAIRTESMRDLTHEPLLMRTGSHRQKSEPKGSGL